MENLGVGGQATMETLLRSRSDNGWTPVWPHPLSLSTQYRLIDDLGHVYCQEIELLHMDAATFRANNWHLGDVPKARSYMHEVLPLCAGVHQKCYLDMHICLCSMTLHLFIRIQIWDVHKICDLGSSTNC